MQKTFKKKISNQTLQDLRQDHSLSGQNQQQNQFDNPLLSREQKVDHFIQKKAQRRKLGQLKLGQKINRTIQLNNQDIIRNIRKYSGNNQIKPSNASFDQNKALLQQTYVNFLKTQFEIDIYHTEDVPDSIIKEIQSNSSKICKGKFSPGFPFFSDYCIVSSIIDTSPPIIGGFVFLSITKGKDGSILYVSSFCSNKGQGNRLMDSVKNLAALLELSSILLSPLPEAISFYKKHGFKKKNEYQNELYFSVSQEDIQKSPIFNNGEITDINSQKNPFQKYEPDHKKFLQTHFTKSTTNEPEYVSSLKIYDDINYSDYKDTVGIMNDDNMQLIFSSSLKQK